MRRERRAGVVLRRRGVLHGRFAAPERGSLERSAEDRAEQWAKRWAADEAVFLPGELVQRVRARARDVARTLATFERLRRGASFQDEVWRRLGARPGFEPAGATIDLGDRREIEKVFAHATSAGRVVARDLYAKLSWIAHDPRDVSLRIRFSFGAEALLDWQKETRRAAWADRYAEALFPESLAITGHAPLVALVERSIGRRARLSERIVYSNAPGGGATFHHDDEPHQLGVVYSQLAGETAWLALSKRELASVVAEFAAGRRKLAHAATPKRALRALDDDDDPELGRLLNATPAFTRRLVERGALFHLRPGDVLMLPSHGPDDVCWHSVFALGQRASLAHSYGIFALRR